MATSEKKMVKKSTAEWFFHNIHVHNKDHNETGDVPKSTKPKVNWFCCHCTDVSRDFAFLNSPDVISVCPSCAGAVRKSRKFTETSQINQFLSHRHNDGDGAGAVSTTVKPDDATPPPTPPSSVHARELPSTSGLGGLLLLHPFMTGNYRPPVDYSSFIRSCKGITVHQWTTG